jgi:hypothetical protein
MSKEPLSIHYFESTPINLKVTNISGQDVLIECVTLQFEADTGAAPNYEDSHPALKLGPQKSGFVTVGVTPVSLYREYTNQFKVEVTGHVESRGRLGKSFSERHSGYYVIISAPTVPLGDIFISFKQPEDQRLANILERYARRAGFTPHVFMRNPQLGKEQWKEIEKLIKECHSVVIVWGQRTGWGDGVEKEIELCRKHNRREILLIAEGVDPPKLYDSKLAYQRFDPSDPAKGLSEAIASLRAQVVKSSVA